MKSVILGENIKVLPKSLSVISFTVVSILLFIWIFVPTLKEFSAISMKANSAVALIFASLALYFLRDSNDNKFSKNLFGQFCAFLTFLIGFLTTIQYLFNIDFGIDELIASDFLNEESRSYPGRMSPIASLCFILLGCGLFFLKVPSANKNPNQ